jgi:hypothetical protein
LEKESEGVVMADYKRMISYMYQYENGVKRRNVGYARIEGKSGQLKITLHMQLLGQLDSIFPTYLIQKDKHNMELIYLGDSMLKGQMLDSKLTADENNIMNSGYSLADMGGLLLFLNENVFYATEWDDTPIVAKEVMAALKPKTQPGSLTEHKNDKRTTEGTNAPAAKAEAKEVFEEKSKPVQTKIETQENNLEIEDSISGLTIEEQLAIPKYQLPRGWKTIERLHKPVLASEERGVSPSELFHIPEMTPTQDIADLFFQPQPNNDGSSNMWDEQKEKTEDKELPDSERIDDMENREMSDQKALDQDSSDREPADEAQFSDQMQEQIEWESVRNGGSGAEQQDQLPQQEPGAAKYFFEHFTRIYPFEDNEIIFCVKMEPKDIGMLPKETWSLSNNSFLMHGFYCYHHLIFAKRKDRFGSQYIIGIPGIYHNRERFMAKMFGFENFKSIRRRELQQGDFGYWYLPVDFNNPTD